MILDDIMTSALVAATAAVAVSALGAATARARRREPARETGGPYRSVEIHRVAAVERPGERLVAAGSALLASAAAPALVVALFTLKWEGIGVTLLPALLVVAARLYAALVTFRGGDLGAARTTAHASLLLDVPLLVFSVVHVHLDDGAPHASLSLALVAAAFALTDGAQALLVLTLP